MSCLGKLGVGRCASGTFFELRVWGFGEGAGLDGLVPGALADGGKRDRRFWGFLDYWPLRWREGLVLPSIFGTGSGP